MLTNQESKSPFAGLDIQFENGDLVVTGEKQEIEESVEGTEDQNETETSTDTTTSTPSPIEARMTALESSLSQITNLLIAQNQQKTSPQKSEDQQLDDDLEGVEDTRGLVKAIKTSVKKLIEENLASVRAEVKEAKLVSEFQTLAAQHGERFTANAASIGKLMDATGLSLSKAWEVIEGTLPKPQQTTKTTTKKPASDLLNKAKNLNLESNNSVNGTTQKEEKKILSIADAVDAAFEQLYQ